jgi:hypothetical protein
MVANYIHNNLVVKIHDAFYSVTTFLAKHLLKIGNANKFDIK